MSPGLSQMRLLVAVLLLAAPVAMAQKIPRAVPVDEVKPVPRALPVGPDGVVVPKAQPVAEDKTPKGQDQDLFDYAMLAFGQKDYTIAAQSFDKYMQTYPQGRQAPWALFRLGECYRLQGRTEESERYDRDVLDRYPSSEAAPNAAYWLGVTAYNSGDFKAAAGYFGICEAKTTVPAVKLAAAFYKSEAYGGLKDHKKQMEALKPVLAVKKGNDFLERALLSTATILQKEQRNKEALPILTELLATSTNPKVQGDAGLKAAIIQSDLKNPEEAVRLYELVLKNKDAPPEQRGAALVGLIGELSVQGNYESVIDSYNRNAGLLPPVDLRPRLLMQLGNAYRAKKSYARAIVPYETILQSSPQTELTFEAAYWRLYCYYMLEDKRLGDLAREFVATYGPAHQDHEFINKARLLVADHHFNRQEYHQAADEYAQIKVTALPENLRSSTWYHKGWSEAESGKNSDAIASLTEFIKGSPGDPGLAKALAKRGLCYKESHDNDKALVDFQRIIKEFPKDDSVELAYYLSAMVHGDQGHTKEMMNDFDMLVKLFPGSAAKAEALYRAGVACIELKDTERALPFLRAAVSTDPKAYGNIGSQKIQLCLWNKKDVEALAKEVDAYRATYKDAVMPPSMLGFLGLTFFNRKEYNRSVKYLTWASTPDVPQNTDPRIWNFLAQSLLEIKSYDDCLKATEHFLATSPDALSKALGLLTKAKALLGLGKLDSAQDAADEGLRIVKDGGVQGQFLILQGDALLAEGDKLETEGNHDGATAKWRSAAGKYVVPSQVLSDARVTPEALSKEAKALDRLGEKIKADEMRRLLKKDYPKYQGQ